LLASLFVDEVKRLEWRVASYEILDEETDFPPTIHRLEKITPGALYVVIKRDSQASRRVLPPVAGHSAFRRSPIWYLSVLDAGEEGTAQQLQQLAKAFMKAFIEPELRDHPQSLIDLIRIRCRVQDEGDHWPIGIDGPEVAYLAHHPPRLR